MKESCLKGCFWKKEIKGCHSREFLSGIFRILSSYAHKAKVLCINNKYVEDPRLQASGMTANVRGFTLIELLVVVLIIGILAAIAVPQYTKAVEKARLTEALTNLKHAHDQIVLLDLQGAFAEDENGVPVGYAPVQHAPEYFDFAGGEWKEDEGVGGYAWYETKNWMYNVDDFSTVSAIPIMHEDDYGLYIYTPGNGDGEGWKTTKECTAYTDFGYSICQSISAQGWTTKDQRS